MQKNTVPKTVLQALRYEYHAKIRGNILGKRKNSDALSVADGSSRTSRDLAGGMAEKMGHPLCESPKTGQTAGSLFTQYTAEFLQNAFSLLGHLRPGEWRFSTSQASLGISAFDQYEYLAELQRLLQEHKKLKSALGGDYLITPDIIVSREPVDDDEINKNKKLVSPEEGIAVHTSLRSGNFETPLPTLHASISCKWTMRSDRAQNTRTEALNLIRNRKGKTPHIAAVTLEPMPSRLASIAMGTGDLDCTYHAALHELIKTADESVHEDQAELLHTMVDGRRLRDISDLPFDLAV